MNITELYNNNHQDTLAIPHDPFAIGPSSPNALATSAETGGFFSSSVMTEDGFPFKYERKNKNDNTNPIPDNDSLQALLKDNLGGRLPENTLKRLLEYTSPLPPVVIKDDPNNNNASTSHTPQPRQQHHQIHASIPQHNMPIHPPAMDNCSECVGHNIPSIFGISTTPTIVDSCCPSTSPNAIPLGMDHMAGTNAQCEPIPKVPFKRTSIDHSFDYQAEYLMSNTYFPQSSDPSTSLPSPQSQLPSITVPPCTGCNDPSCQSSIPPANCDMSWNMIPNNNNANPQATIPLQYSYGSIMKSSKSKKKDQQEDYIDLSDYLNMPQSEAARRLNIPTSSLSKKWKEVSGDRKWPYRTVCKLDKEISSILDHITTRPLPPDIEQTLGYLLNKRNQELRPVAIRFRKKELMSAAAN